MRKDIEEFVTRYGTGNVMPGKITCHVFKTAADPMKIDVMQFEPFSSMDIQSTPSSSIHHGPVLETKELPPMPESVNDNNDPAPTTEQQHVKEQSHDDSQGDAMTTAMAEVEELLSIPESKPAETKSTHEQVVTATKSTTNEHADEQPSAESKSTSEHPVKETTTMAVVINENVAKESESPAKETITANQSVMNEEHAQSTSVSPEEPPIPATPPSPVNKDSKQREDNEDHISAVGPAVTVAAAAAAVATTGMEISTNNDAQQHESALPEDKYKPMPNPEFQDGSSDSEQKRMSRVDSGNDMQASIVDPKPTDAVVETTLANASHQELKPTTRSLDATVAAVHETQPANESMQGVHLSDPPPSAANNKNDDDGSSENDYSLPPPKAEKWVISSIRRPQQLPVRVQNVRMSMNASSPSLTAPVVHEPDSQTPTASTSTGNKFHRPNAPLKIEIPNKPTSSPTLRNNMNSQHQQQQQHPYQQQQAPQAAAQQVIAAGRAHAHQTQSWQSPVNPSPSRRFSAMDGTRWQQQPPLEPLEQTLYEIEGEQQQSKPITDAPRPLESASHHKKGHLSSFVKGVLKSDQQDKRASALAAPLSSTTDKKEKRFSMNIFGGKKDKRQHKQFNDDPPQQQQPAIYEDEEVIHNSLGSRSTPVLSRPVSAVPVMRSMNNNYQSSPSPQRMMQQPVPSSSTGKAPAVAPRQDTLEDGSPIIEYGKVWIVIYYIIS